MCAVETHSSIQVKPSDLDHPAADPRCWELDPGVCFLNHGSFGACPREVLAVQSEIRARMEREPVRFFVRELESELDRARRALARFVGAVADDLVFVPNATAGVNTVLRSLKFEPGEELLVTDHEYNACRNALEVAAARAGARVTVVRIPFPIRSPDAIVEAILDRVGSRTRLALLDHVTSQTGLIFPLGRIVPELRRRGVLTLVDGAHAPGMLPLDLTAFGADFYTGNCHKWICAPKGAGFLWVKRRHQRSIRPLSISHGANSSRRDRSRFLIEFGWTGTSDPSAFLSVPAALRFMGRLLPGGWPALKARNRALALEARRILCEAIELDPPCPESLLGSLAALPLPPGRRGTVAMSPLYLDPLQDRLWERHRIEVPVIPWPKAPARLIRISAAAYNRRSQYELLAGALRKLLRR